MKRPETFSKSLVFLLTALMFVTSGCGYRFSVEGMGPQIGGGEIADSGPLVKLVIRDFKNRTIRSNLESKYTRYVRQEFAASSGAKVLYNDGQADFVLKGEIVSVNVPTLTFSTTVQRESRVNVVVNVTVEDQKTGRIVWSQSATGSGEFFVNQSSGSVTGQDQLQFNQVLQDRALEQAGQDVAEILAADFWDARDQGTFSSDGKNSIKSSHETGSPSLAVEPSK